MDNAVALVQSCLHVNGYYSGPGKEVVRVKFRVEPLREKAKHGGICFGTNAVGEKTVEEVYVRGENLKHVI